MKRIISIILAVVLIVGVVACTPLSGVLWESMIVYGAEASNTTEVSGNIMAVFYLLPFSDESKVVFWCTDAQIIDRGDGKWDVYSPQGTMIGVNQFMIDYGLYKYQPLLNPQTNTYYLGDLDLQEVTWQDLPHERHIALLANVYLVDGKPRADVIRLYMGVEYLVTGCRVTQTAYDAYVLTHTLEKYKPAYGYLSPENENCFVAVDFIHENFTGTDIVLPFVADKLLK